jgi:alpha-mannosidase
MIENLNCCKALYGKDYWADRICRQLVFARFLCSMQPDLSRLPLAEAERTVAQCQKTEGVITKSCVLHVEQVLAPYAELAKSFVVDCVGHAHIDMNWMWGIQETVSIVLDTFRTMLTLMDAYPFFTFAQSQAATYRIVEEYEPGMLGQIRQRVAEGRWEVTASAWTEFDKNMASGESHLRQYRYASEYMCNLLGLEAGGLSVGFEPDTFGHNARLPDILSQSGITYYYHCRGEVDESLYRWRGPGGGEVLVFREPTWYLGPAVTPLHDPSRGTMGFLQMDMAREVAKIYESYGIRRTLQVYGVGDHGGGPTRMDIEGLADMAKWPCYPAIEFSTFGNFFRAIEGHKDRLPLVEGEVNRIFSGCYTSQSALKRANHESEKMLYEAELFSSGARLCLGADGPDDAGVVADAGRTSASLADAWKGVLFNQFHDILPGSCTSESKAYALGLHQSAQAIANSVRTAAMRRIAYSIDTSGVGIEALCGQRASGAGVGYLVDRCRVSPVGTVEGPRRVVTLFNTSGVAFEGVAEIVLWDWEDSCHCILCRDSEGREVPSVVVKEGETYWQHSLHRLLMRAVVPPFGYASYLVEASTEPVPDADPFKANPRSEQPLSFVLDNGIVRAELSPETLEMTSFKRLATGEEFLAGPSGFLFVEEDPAAGMTAWIVGREQFARPDALFVDHSVDHAVLEVNELRQTVSYRIKIADSEIAVQLVLDAGASALRCFADVVWREAGSVTQTPQLSYRLRLRGERQWYWYDVPFGILKRSVTGQHMPALSWIGARFSSSILQLATRGKYGFCADSQSMRVVLLRSSSDPDKFPEIGVHHLDFSIACYPGDADNATLLRGSHQLSSDLQQVTHGAHGGSLPMRGELFSLDGPCVLSAAIPSVDAQSVELHVFETEGTGGSVFLHCHPQWRVLSCAPYGSKDRVPVEMVNACPGSFRFLLPPYGLFTVQLSCR